VLHACDQADSSQRRNKATPRRTLSEAMNAAPHRGIVGSLRVGESWIVTSAFDEWAASLGGSVSLEARALLRRVFDEHGPVGRERVQRIGRDHQLALARVAV